jgi:hypothetical protein
VGGNKVDAYDLEKLSTVSSSQYSVFRIKKENGYGRVKRVDIVGLG